MEYQVHEDFRQTVSAEFGEREPISTWGALYSWWEFEDEKALSDEIERRFGNSIPLKLRSELRGY